MVVANEACACWDSWLYPVGSGSSRTGHIIAVYIPCAVVVGGWSSRGDVVTHWGVLALHTPCVGVLGSAFGANRVVVSLSPS